MLLAAACRNAAPPPPVAPPPRAAKAPPRPRPPLTVPVLANEGVTLRLVVLGDGGEQGPVHTAAFTAAASVLRGSARAKVPALVLMPGDLTYPEGLDGACPAARARLVQDYFEPLPDARFVAVAGNHDHGNPGATESPEIARRHAYFDCAHAARLGPSLGWDPATCACEPRWEYPGGGAVTGTRELVAPAPGRAGFQLVTYDSQAAIARPAALAEAIAAALDAVPRDRAIVLMGHHPWRSRGAHARPGSVRPQDLESPPYRAMLAALEPVIAARRDRLALAIFGHDHHVEFSPGAPPIVISGAAAKATPLVTPPAPGDATFAAGDTPGFAVVDLHAAGTLALTFVSDAPTARVSLTGVIRDIPVTPSP